MGKRLGLVIGLVVVAYFWQTRIKQGPIYVSEKSLEGKTVFLTGGNAGIGKFTAHEIARRGARLIIASRNVKKSEAVKTEISKATGNKNIRVVKLDLEDFESVRRVSADIISTEEHIDYLVNNAGAMFLKGLTTHGYGRVFAVNHLGHFLLTNLLLDKLKAQSAIRPVRIINLSSEAYKMGTLDWDNLHYDPDGFFQNVKVYCDSKLANVYFTSELDKKLQDYDNITTYAVHPGIIFSELGNTIPMIYRPLAFVLSWPMLRPTEYGIQTTMYTMLDDEVTKLSGKYFSDCAMDELLEHAVDDAQGERLWEESMRMVELD